MKPMRITVILLLSLILSAPIIARAAAPDNQVHRTATPLIPPKSPTPQPETAGTPTSQIQPADMQTSPVQVAPVGFWEWLWASPKFWQVLPSLITGFMALIVGLILLNFNHWSTRRSARQDHIRMLMDIDNQLIGRPYLWAIYGHALTPSSEDKKEELERLMAITADYRTLQEDALMYACFNMFEAVYDFHRHLGFFRWHKRIVSRLMFWSDRRKADQEYKDSWDRFAKDFFSADGGRRSWELFQRQRNLYSESFQRWVEDFRKHK